MKILREKLLSLERWDRIKRDSLMPQRDGGITRWMLETRYVNHYVLEHIRDRICMYKSERMKKIKERWIAPSGAIRAFSRNPFVSRVSTQPCIEDWSKMLAFKDSNRYTMTYRGVYFIEVDGVVRPR